MKAIIRFKENWPTYFFFILTIVTAIVFRCWHQEVFQVWNHVCTSFHSIDAIAFEREARSLAQGDWSGIGETRPPLVSIIIGFIYKISPSIYNIKALFLLLNSISCGLIFLIANRLFRIEVAILTGLGCAISFGFGFLTHHYNSENLYIFLLLAIVLMLTNRRKSWSVSRCGLLGFIAGLALLTRAEFIYLWLMLLIWWLVFNYEDKKSLLKGALMFAISLVFILPLTYRNYHYFNRINNQIGKKVYSEFVLISAYGGLNFYKANSPFNLPYFDRRTYGVKSSPNSKQFNLTNPTIQELINEGYKLGFNYIRSHPQQFFYNTIRKIDLYMNSFAYGMLPSNQPFGMRGFTRIGDTWIPEQEGLKLPLSILSLGGFLLIILENRRDGSLIWLINGYYILITILFFGYARFGIMMLPFIFMAVSFFVYKFIYIFVSVLNRNSMDSWPNILHTICFYSLICITIIIPIYGVVGWLSGDTPYIQADYSRLSSIMRIGYEQQTAATLKNLVNYVDQINNARSLSLNTITRASIHFYLGECYRLEGCYNRARLEYLQALSWDPIHPTANTRLGELSLHEFKDYDKAIFYFERQLAIYPQQHQASVVKRLIYEAVKKGDKG